MEDSKEPRLDHIALQNIEEEQKQIIPETTHQSESIDSNAVYSYQRSDGTIEKANSVEEVQKVCPFIGKMSLEEAKVMLEISNLGQQIMDQQSNHQETKSQTSKKPNLKKIDKNDIFENKAKNQKKDNLISSVNVDNLSVENNQRVNSIKTELINETSLKYVDHLDLNVDSDHTYQNTFKENSTKQNISPKIIKSISVKKSQKQDGLSLNTKQKIHHSLNKAQELKLNKKTEENKFVRLDNHHIIKSNQEKDSAINTQPVMENLNLKTSPTSIEINEEPIIQIEDEMIKNDQSNLYINNFLKTIETLLSEDGKDITEDQNNIDLELPDNLNRDSEIDQKKELGMLKTMNVLYEKIVMIKDTLTEEIDQIIEKIVTTIEDLDAQKLGEDALIIDYQLQSYAQDLFKILDIDYANNEINDILDFFKTKINTGWREVQKLYLDLENVGTREAKYGIWQPKHLINNKVKDLNQYIGSLILFYLEKNLIKIYT